MKLKEADAEILLASGIACQIDLLVSELVGVKWAITPFLLTWVIRNLAILSVRRPFSLDNIISNMSPLSFSIMTKIRSGVSNIHSKLTTPWCERFCKMDTSFLSWASCLVGKRSLSITLTATARPDFLYAPDHNHHQSVGKYCWVFRDTVISTDSICDIYDTYTK